MSEWEEKAPEKTEEKMKNIIKRSEWEEKTPEKTEEKVEANISYEWGFGVLGLRTRRGCRC